MPILAGDPTDASNTLVWTVYPRTFVVGDMIGANLADELQAALARATGFTLCDPTKSALVSFSWDMFGANDPQQIDLLQPGACGGSAANHCQQNILPNHCPCDPTSMADPCLLNGDADGQVAGLCIAGDRIVVDGLDRDALPGGVILSTGACDAKLVRMYGSSNVLRGLLLEGSQTPNPNPDPAIECTAQQRTQVDTVAITGSQARRNRIEQSIIVGPTCGDAISVDNGAGVADQQGAGDNVISASRITGAVDRGMKVDFGAFATIERSCVHDNASGGIQSTLGGHLVATENVIQRNRGGQGQNGITVIDSCSTAGCAVCPADDPECVSHRRSTLATQGNVVRFSGGRGISVRDDAHATLESDYVAGNAIKGSVVETTDMVPLDAQQVEQVPVASFHGVAVVCNYSGSNPGVGAELRRDDDGVNHHDAPQVSYGDAQQPGRNAFTSNKNTAAGANFLLTNIATPPLPPAMDNQWAHCGTGALCDVPSILASDITPANSPVELTAPGMSLEGARAGVPAIDRVVPGRPAKGDIVRVYGDNFDAIEGNPTRDQCTANVSACAPNDTCPTGPCVNGSCPCSIEDPAVQARNQATNANRVFLKSGNTVVGDVYPDAVTPTMLAFRMPIDCFAPLVLEVEKRGVVETTLVCDRRGCLEKIAGTPCDDGFASTVDDHCDGDGSCVGLPAVTTSTSTSTTSSTSSSTAPGATTVTTTTQASLASTTSSTLPRVCQCVPALCQIDECQRPRLHRKAEKIARRIEHACDAGRQPKTRWVRRLTKVLARCR